MSRLVALPGLVALPSLVALLGLATLLGCTTREPSRTEPRATPTQTVTQERPPLVTVELSVVDDAARERLAARLGPEGPLAGAGQLLAIHHHIAEGWHIYWRNPGESGLRTKIDVQAQRARAGEVLFPAPERFVAAGQVTYGWGHEAVMFVPLTELGDDPTVELRTSYLACAESCIPGEAQLEAHVASLARDSQPTTLSMLDRVPEPAGDRVLGVWTDGALQLRPKLAGLELDALFPYLSETAELGHQQADDDGLELHYRFSGPPARDQGQGVLRVTIDGQPRWLELSLPWPQT